MRLDDFALHAVFAVLCLAFGAAEISAQKGSKPLSTIYVDSKDGADSAKCGGSSLSACKTINWAVGKTEPGGIIELVRKDVYPRESRDCANPYAPAIIDKSVTIKGSAGKAGMPCISAWTNNPGITIKREINDPANEVNVIIKGVRFLRDRRSESRESVGIAVDSGTNLVVENGYFAQNLVGIRFSEGKLTVRGTNFYYNRFGISLIGSTKKMATIENSTFQLTTRAAIHAEPLSDISVSGSTISKLEPGGVPFEAVVDKQNPGAQGSIVFAVQDMKIDSPPQALMSVEKGTPSDVKLFMKNVTIR